jgi:pimeloyl-ACP methyl ester carboxylesterase
MQTDPSGPQTNPTGHYAAINGLDLYYELHGAGMPLVLLHGAFGLTGMFGALIPQLSAGRQVIAVDLQAHGRTADIDRPLSLEAMADDVAALIEHLGLEVADVMGYSMGGGVAMQTAIRHPQVVRKLVVVSAPCRRDGWYPEVRAGLDQLGPGAAEMMKQGPIYPAYTAVAPRPDDWPVLVEKMGDLVRRDYDWTEDFAAIQTPVMIVVGDADSVRTSHAVEMFELLGGGKGDPGWDSADMPNARLAVLPGTTHYNSFLSPLLAPAVTVFLDEPMPGATH